MVLKSEKFKAWFKGIGVAGFIFFLLKGIIWIVIFLGWAKCSDG